MRIPVLLPPLPEQARIVASVNAAFVCCGSARKRVDRAIQLLKSLRQRAIDAGCSGELTEHWRNSGDFVSIDRVIQDLRSARLSKTQTISQRKMVSKAYEIKEARNSDALPAGWRYVALAKVCSSFNYGTSAKSQRSGDIPVLRMGNIQNGRIDWQDLVYTSDQEEINNYRLTPGTVLFNRTNSPELVGKTAIYRGEGPAIFAGYLIRINPLPPLDPEYLNLCLNTTHARQFCSRIKTDGVSQSNINAQKLGTFEIPLCSVSEQKEIVHRVNGLIQLTDKIGAKVAVTRSRLNKLTSCILARAFRGELVATEAELAAKEMRTYESAKELLARITSGRSSRGQASKSR